jgi:hypothetical protein
MPDNVITQPTEQPVTVTRAAGFVVVSWWQSRSSDDRTGSFEYSHCKTLNDALSEYEEYQNGEFARAREMGIFACDACGMPLHRLDPARLMRLMAEQRSGR